MRESGSAAERSSPPRADLIALAILTALITLLFIDVLVGASSLYIRDITYGAYPAKKVVRETVLGGEFPYWNRSIGAGQPLAANPANQIFYPPTWLVFLPSYDLGFAFLLLLHVYIAAWGMYVLLRSMSCGPPAAFFGALSFALGGGLLGVHDLLPLLLSVAWIPLICLFARRFLLHGSRRDFAVAALFFGIQVLLGEAAVVLQTGIILGLYALHSGAKRGGPKAIARSVGAVALLSVAALLVASVQILPTVDHAADSVRARGFAFDNVTSWSMPPARLAELINPNVLGHHMLNGRAVYWGGVLYPDRGVPFVRSLYLGILITALALAGMMAGAAGRRLVVAILVVSVLLALGAHTPLWRILYDAGLARSIRYPEKFILMGLFALTVFAARSLDLLLSGDFRMERAARRAAAILAAALGAIAILAVTPWYAPLFIDLWNPASKMFSEMLAASRSGWLLSAARAALLFILLRNLMRVRRPVWLSLLAVLVLLDLGTTLPEITPRISRDYFREPPRIAQEFLAARQDCRLFHFAAWRTATAGDYFTPHRDLYWIHKNAMYPMMPNIWGIRTAIERDLEKTSLLPTANFVDAVWALSYRHEGWAEVVAAMSNVCAIAVYNDPAAAFARAREDRKILQPVRLIHLAPSPRYSIAEAVESIRNDAELVEKLASGHFSLRTAFIAGPPFAPAPGLIRSARETANTARIEVETRGRAFLVMSVTPHKYWRITIDGADAPAVITNIGYQGVVIPTSGRHIVEMRYRNPLIAVGAVISLLTTLILLIAAVLSTRR